MNKFSFKTVKPTGKYKSFFNYNHTIKLNSKECGYIEKDKPFTIRLMVTKADINEDGNPSCTWKWITLTKKSDSLDEAKEFLNKNIEVIINKFPIRTIE